ncbi:MAG: hypothetical protein E7474_03610 [Ruminococcaceae bacterium]|nr:hypothetical protein [Oscillospiraceae bacterium]
MRFDRRFFASLLVVCLMLGSIVPASAATLQATYGEATYYDIAVTNYSRMLAFQNGVVAAANTQKQYGLIDATGKVVVPFQYGGIWALGGGLFKVSDQGRDFGGKQGIIDSTGKVVREMKENVWITYCNGVIRIYENGTESYYTTDMKPATAQAYRNGTAAGAAQYDGMWTILDGSYSIAYKYADGLTCSVLDKNGKVVIPAMQNDIEGYTDKSRVVFIAGGTSVYDETGKTVVAEGTYDYIRSRGSILIVHKGEQKGAIDFTGKVVVPLGSYAEIGDRNSDGYIAVVTNDADAPESKIIKDGAVVKTISGKLVTSEVYFRDFAFTTSTNYDRKYGMMDVNGNILMDEAYHAISTDGNGNLLTINENEQTWGYIYGLRDMDCKQIFEDKYSQLNYLKDNKYKLYDGTYYGVRKLDGSDVIPLRYRDMRLHTMDFIELYDGTYHSIVNLSNQVIVPQTKEDIELFKGTYLTRDLQRAYDNAKSEDGYDKYVQPFCIKTDEGYATVYADFVAGKGDDTLPYRASNINADGKFVYQAANGLFGFASLGGTAAPPAPSSQKDEVVPTNQNLTVDGVAQNTEIYNINGSNYFKLRDIAALLSGTGSQFSVTYDEASKTIVVKTGESYEKGGGDLTVPSAADMSAKAAGAVKSSQSIRIDGVAVSDMSVYNLGGNNYFKLRDLGEKLGFDVDYDNATRTMIVKSR